MRKITEQELRIKIFKKWKKILDDIQIINSFEDFEKLDIDIQFGKIKFKTTATYGLEFYKERFFMLDYILIWKKRSAWLKSKRLSIYDTESIAKKQNISIEEASNIVKQRKFLTSGSLATYVYRYGEEVGKQRYEEFSNKCIISLEVLVGRHGEDVGNKKWENYCNTRDSGSYEYFLKKNNYDESLATLEHSIFKDLCSKTSSTEYFLKKYGEDYVEQLSHKKGYNSTVDYFIASFGEAEGIARYKELNLKKAITIEKMISRYGEEEGIIRYNSWKTAVYQNNISAGNISKSSIALFKLLESKLHRQLQYGKKGDELQLVNPKTNRHYYYDCYDAKSNTIMEFNGSLWHPSPLLSEDERLTWRLGYSTSSITYYEALQKDKEKNDMAIKSGYNLIVIWDYDINTKIKMKKTINYLLEQLDGKNIKD